MEICFLNKNRAEKSALKGKYRHSREEFWTLRVLHSTANGKVLATNASPMSWEATNETFLNVCAFTGVR